MQDEITAELRSGDAQAFRMFVETYRGYLYKTIFAILRNEKDAEDALQETLIKIYYALPTYESQGWKTWITRIAVNHSIDFKRKQMRQLEDATEDGYADRHSTRENVELSVLHNERKQRLLARLQSVPDAYRDVIHAYYLEEKSYKEIAAEQHIEVKTVEMKLYRARSWIRKHWKEDEF